MWRRSSEVGDQAIALAVTVAALLVVAPSSGTAIGECSPGEGRPLANFTEANITFCVNSCQERLSLYGMSKSDSTKEECSRSCHDSYAKGLCHCRRRQCLDSMPCSVACFLSGVFESVAESGDLRICTRTEIRPNSQLDMAFYWLPPNKYMKRVFYNPNATLFQPVSFHPDAGQVWRQVQLLRSTSSSSATSFPVSLHRIGTNITGIPYSYVFQPWAVYLYMHDGTRATLTSKKGDLHSNFYSPECHNIQNDSLKCADSEYQVERKTEYYPPLTVLNVSAHQDQLPQHQSKEKVAAYVNRTREELMYQATFNLSVKYERKKEEVSDRLGCPVHACWCWDSCNVRHILNITVTIDGHIRREINRDKLEERQLLETCLADTYVLQLSITVSGKELFGGWTDNYPSLERRANSAFHITVNATVQSYYAVDSYFGPRRAAARFSTGPLVVEFVPVISDTPPPPPQPELGSSSDPAVIAVSVTLSIVALAFLAGFAKYAWNYRKWNCVRKNKNLEQVKQFRPLRTSTNTEYVSAGEFAPPIVHTDGLPRIARRCIVQKEKLGSGQFGDVYKAVVFGVKRKDESMQVAAKVLKTDSSEKDQSDFLTEAKHLNSVSHPNVVKLLGVCLDGQPKMILLELMDGGNLHSYLQANRPGAARPAWDDGEYLDIALDITAGLRYLESKKYVHRDIAARNCLLSFDPVSATLAGKPSSSGRVVKISDFGLTRVVCNTQEYYRIMNDNPVLPIRWMAPESLEQKIFTGKSDVWSFGILFWEIFTYGQTPYGEKTNHFDVYRFVTLGGVLEQPQFCPPAMFRVMKQCWAKSPSDRPTFRKLHDLLNTFQQRLRERRTTLLTTLESFASVSGIGDIDPSQLPRIPGPQRVAVAPRPGSVGYGVYEDDSELSDNCFDSSVYPSESDNAFDSPTASPIQKRKVPISHGQSPLTTANAIGANLYPRRQRVRRKSRSNSTSREDVSIAVPSKPSGGRRGSNSGHEARRMDSSSVFAEDGDTDSLSHVDVPLMVTEYCPRKPLSPIASASSVPDDVRSQRRSRTESSGSAFAPATVEEVRASRRSRSGSTGSALAPIPFESSL